MLSEAEIREIKRYNARISKIRKIIFKVSEIITGILFLAAAFYPHYPVCLALLIGAMAAAIISNQFCDD